MSLADFSRPRVKGIRAIRIQEGDRLLEARLTNEGDHIIMATTQGKAIRFTESEVRVMGRTAAGVRGITLADQGDLVVGLVSTKPGKSTNLMVIASKGYGKRSSLSDYRITKRGGKGIKTLQITPKTGLLIALKAVDQQDELILMNDNGLALRMEVATLRTLRRATQGVRLLRLKGKEKIAAIEVVSSLLLEKVKQATNT